MYLISTRSLLPECGRVVGESLLVPVLMKGRKTMVWWQKEKSRIRVVQMGNLRYLSGIKRTDTMLNVQVRELHGVMKGVGEKIDESVLQQFDNIEKIENK